MFGIGSLLSLCTSVFTDNLLSSEKKFVNFSVRQYHQVMPELLPFKKDGMIFSN